MERAGDNRRAVWVGNLLLNICETARAMAAKKGNVEKFIHHPGQKRAIIIVRSHASAQLLLNELGDSEDYDYATTRSPLFVRLGTMGAQSAKRKTNKGAREIKTLEIKKILISGHFTSNEARLEDKDDSPVVKVARIDEEDEFVLGRLRHNGRPKMRPRSP
jgi:hypothetical protein